jgi:Flp pilus assembly pilin Flp
MALRDFIGNEDGATTVDFVVMTSGVTGMCIAVAMLVSGGIENLSSDVGTTMSDYEITGELMIGPGGLAQLTLDVPQGAAQAVFTFDLIGGDSLDNETATVMINGQPVTIATGNHGSISFADAGVPGVTVETTIQSQGQQLGGSTNDPWRESVTTVSITVDNPGSSVTLGVASSADQPVNDEFFGIDNVNVDAL